MKILVTGSSGLIGRSLVPALQAAGHEIVCFDNHFSNDHPYFGDILDIDSVHQKIHGCHGVVHLAAVSRVIWGHQDPKKCWQHNVFGVKNVIRSVTHSPIRPWLLLASSREVYGQQEQLPCSESHSLLQPKNIYAQSKLRGEELVASLKALGLISGIVRLSSVYGDVADHPTRVVPAFARAAVLHKTLHVEGKDNMCDFTHVSDVVDALLKSVLLLSTGQAHRTVHLTSGVGTPLLKLAQLMIAANPHSKSTIVIDEPRNYDVSRFIGDPSLAQIELDWKAKISIEQGIQMMIAAYAAELKERCVS